jgi:hypothetical protein
MFWRREKSLASARNQTAFHPPHSPVTTLTELSQFPDSTTVEMGHFYFTQLTYPEFQNNL